jgi:hypothetical protein
MGERSDGWRGGQIASERQRTAPAERCSKAAGDEAGDCLEEHAADAMAGLGRPTLGVRGREKFTSWSDDQLPESGS